MKSDISTRRSLPGQSTDTLPSRSATPTLFSHIGKIYLLPVHLSLDKYEFWANNLVAHGAEITHELPEAQLVLANLSSPQRTEMELRRRGAFQLAETSVLQLKWAQKSLNAGVLQDRRDFILYSNAVKTSQPRDEETMKRARGNSTTNRNVVDSGSDSSSKLTTPRKRTRRAPEVVRDLDPIFLKRNSCERPHPLICQNEELSSILKKIRHIRELLSNEISVRAYSSAIASIRSYPYKIENANEISRLPGCGGKIVKLVDEYLKTGAIESETKKINEPEMQAIERLYNIWGVGGKTAVDWYNKNGWKTVQDVKEHGWNELSKAQKAGVMHYDEFSVELTHSQVRFIADQIQQHAQAIFPGAQSVVCGSYRRGAQTHSDVDIVLSVPSDEPGVHLVLLESLVKSLKQANLVSEVLSISSFNSSRQGRGSLLDLALVIWSTIPTSEHTLNHYRVDIICVDWAIVGCAVVGWTGGTTFERDIRIHAKEIGLKCSSSGIFDRKTGQLVDTSASTIESAEKRVFEVLRLPYISPDLRNTG
ncbi:hypothetical protein V1520DRAFT_310499 [Lipomyces starkeyi]|uniref:DNA polymerase n=1 Tax=Lipomyces starkeyi NRRL Y-11557 TaxID=675824 RepID=A0A1E3QFI2_LIPST|nr:hypothetical protein LIPSTDRAFT_396 [Lipomyces starkeyi NRRL Y-11557]